MRQLFIIILAALLPKVVWGENDKVLPIMAWHSVQPKDATDERYRELKEAGFNISYTIMNNDAKALEMLDMAERNGMKIMFSCTSLKTNPEATVKKVKNHPGLYGYFLKDEPTTEMLDELGAWAKRIMSEDSEHPCYINLRPIGSFKPLESYRDHLRAFSEKVGTQMLSFDLYPIFFEESKITDTYGIRKAANRYFHYKRMYQNLEMIREEALRTKRPFWAFALVTAFDKHPVPEMQFLRFQMYVNLAYGAQGLQYFAYWNPEPKKHDFHLSPITLNGKRSLVYELVRDMNKELQNRAFVFVDGKVDKVRHLCADEVPYSTTQLTSLPSQVKKIAIGKDIPLDKKISASEGSMIVSEITNGNNKYIMLVNTNYVDKLPVHIEFTGEAYRIRKDGTKASTSLYEPDYILEPGDTEIFQIK